jgi:hypothetical protein
VFFQEFDHGLVAALVGSEQGRAAGADLGPWIGSAGEQGAGHVEPAETRAEVERHAG